MLEPLGVAAVCDPRMSSNQSTCATDEPSRAPREAHFCLVHDDLCDPGAELAYEDWPGQWLPVIEILWHLLRSGSAEDRSVSVSALVGSKAVHLVADVETNLVARPAFALKDFQEALWTARTHSSKGADGISWVERSGTGSSRQALLDNLDSTLRDAPDDAVVLAIHTEAPLQVASSSPYAQLVALGSRRPAFSSKLYVILAAQEHNATALFRNIVQHLATRVRVAHVDLFGRDSPPGLRFPTLLLAQYLVEQWCSGNLAFAASAVAAAAHSDQGSVALDAAEPGSRVLPKPRWQLVRSRSPRQKLSPEGCPGVPASPPVQAAAVSPSRRTASEGSLPQLAGETRGRPGGEAAINSTEAQLAHERAQYGLRVASKCSRSVFFGGINAGEPLIVECPCCSSSIQVVLEAAAGQSSLGVTTRSAGDNEDDTSLLRGSRIILSSLRAARKTFRAIVEEPVCSSFCPLCRRPLAITFGQGYKDRPPGTCSEPVAPS